MAVRGILQPWGEQFVKIYLKMSLIFRFGIFWEILGNTFLPREVYFGQMTSANDPTHAELLDRKLTFLDFDKYFLLFQQFTAFHLKIVIKTN